jgi:hypothetical protein
MNMITNTSMALVHCTDDIKQWVLDILPEDDGIYSKIWQDITDGNTLSDTQSHMVCEVIHECMNGRIQFLMEANNDHMSMDNMEGLIIYVEAYNHYSKAE